MLVLVSPRGRLCSPAFRWLLTPRSQAGCPRPASSAGHSSVTAQAVSLPGKPGCQASKLIATSLMTTWGAEGEASFNSKHIQADLS